jgi:hypothetical protein
MSSHGFSAHTLKYLLTHYQSAELSARVQVYDETGKHD